MSGIQLPGRVQVGVVEHHNGQAFPSSTGIGQQFHIFGGLTKLEWMTGMVVSGGLVQEMLRLRGDALKEGDISEERSNEDNGMLTGQAVILAEEILAECAFFQAKDAPPTA